MNYVRRQDKPFRMTAAFVAALVVLTLAGAVIPAQAQTYTVLYDAPGTPGVANPIAQTTALGRDGNVYTSALGGTMSYGALFKITPSGTVTIVYNVGYYDVGGATLGTDGNFYGIDVDGGTYGLGQVYKITPGGVETVLYDFTGAGDGYYPNTAPTEATNGKFYGTTPYSNNGNIISTVYTVTSSGAFTTIHTFTNAEGQLVVAGLIQGTDGNFYGVAQSQGANGFGSIFKMTPSGGVTVLHSFTGADGKLASYPLVQASDGTFYGVTQLGGVYGSGVVFKITPGGTYTVLYNFDPGAGDGNNPSASLIQATDGKLYGVTYSGGPTNNGTIYSITTAGTFQTLYNFCSQSGCTDGDNPTSPLRQNTNGILYGATYTGGTSNKCQFGCGVVYSLGVGLGPFVSLVSTSGIEGAKIGILGQAFSSSSVVKFGGVQATTIKRTGKTFISATVPTGALTGSVTVTTGSTKLTSNTKFRVTPTFPSFSPTSGPVGTPVVLTGTGLAQTTKVTFGGVAATTVMVNSDSQVTADVPTGAVTGKIVIKTKGGSARSKTDFTVTQ